MPDEYLNIKSNLKYRLMRISFFVPVSVDKICINIHKMYEIGLIHNF